MVATYADEGTNKAGLRMGVAAAYIFLLVYSIGVDVAGVVFYSELCKSSLCRPSLWHLSNGALVPNHIRAKGLALSIAVIALTDLVYLQVTATVSFRYHTRTKSALTLSQAFATIGWKFYLVFIIISGLGFFVVMFFLPETKGIPLEEMAKLFGDTEDIAVFSDDIHVDHNTHELVVGAHDGSNVQRVATEGGLPPGTPKIRRSVDQAYDEKTGDARVVEDEKVAGKV